MTGVLGIFKFLQFGWADILDIGMVALLIFFLLRSIRGDSTVLNIVLVLALLLVAQAIASALNMRMMTVLLNALLDVGVLAILIIFQPEIRHLLNRFAMRTGISRRTGDLFNRLLGTSTMVTGISEMQARPNISCFREKPGPLVAVMDFLPPMEAPIAAPNPAISSSVCINLPPTWGRRAANCSAISVEGVMG